MEEQEWVRIATAPHELIAASWREALLEEQIPARIAPGDVSSIFGMMGMPVGVMVPSEYADRATTLLNDMLNLDETDLLDEDDLLSSVDDEDNQIGADTGNDHIADPHKDTLKSGEGYVDDEDAPNGNTTG